MSTAKHQEVVCLSGLVCSAAGSNLPVAFAFGWLGLSDLLICSALLCLARQIFSGTSAKPAADAMLV